MYHKTLRVFFLFLIILLLLFSSSATLTGCSRKPAKSPPKKQETEKKESEKLNKLQGSIEKVLKDFEKEYLKQTAPVPKAPAQLQGAQGKQQGEQGRQQGQQNGGQSGGEQKEQGGKQDQSQQQQEGQGGAQGQQEGGQAQKGGGQATQQPQGPNWPKFEMAVTQLHNQWNEFQGEAIKSGATTDMLDSFNSKLNELTINLTEQDLYGGLLAANDLYVETVPFERLFITKVPPDLKRVTHYARDATYRALHGEQEEAMDSMASCMRTWESVKPQLDDTDNANKVEFALKDLEEAIPQKDPNLIKIEAQILEQKIQDLIESLEAKK